MFGNKRTCGVCGTRYSSGLDQCPRCGFRPEPIAGMPPEENRPEGFPPPTNFPPPDSVAQRFPPPQDYSQGPRVIGPVSAGSATRLIGPVLALVVGAILIGAALFALQTAREVSPAIPDIIDINRPPPGDIGTIEDPTEMSPERCVSLMRKYLRRLFFDLANQDSDDLSAGFIEASNVFGPGSRHYRALVDIFSKQELSSAAALGQPKKAFRGSLPLIDKACKA